MRILSPNDSSHTITLYVRDHTESHDYIIRLRNENTKEIEDVAANSHTYDALRGILSLTFEKTVTEGQWYSIRVYTSGGLTVDSTLYTVDSTVLTCDMTLIGGIGYQVYRGMVYCTTQTDMNAYKYMGGKVVEPSTENNTYKTPA